MKLTTENMMNRWILAAILPLALFGCGDDSTTNNGTPNSAVVNNATTNNDANDAGVGDDGGNSSTPNNAQADAGQTNNTTPGEVTEMLAEGTARETRVFVPSDYDASQTYPLVVLLHGYSASGFIQDQYFGISDVQDEYQFVLIRPDGTQDAQNNRFWNATEACCDFANTGVDDEQYITDLIDEAIEKLSINPKRVYLIGHSNGGFMSYRMACNRGDKIAGIVSLAGANFTNEMACDSDIPVAIAQAHGTLDATIPYDGNQFVPSALESLQPWAVRNGCVTDLSDTGEELDLDSAAAGFETSITEHADCSSGFAVELWTMDQSGHIPTVTDDWAPTLLDFLYQFERP